MYGRSRVVVSQGDETNLTSKSITHSSSPSNKSISVEKVTNGLKCFLMRISTVSFVLYNYYSRDLTLGYFYKEKRVDCRELVAQRVTLLFAKKMNNGREAFISNGFIF